jgi:hypothetical protein
MFHETQSLHEKNPPHNLTPAFTPGMFSYLRGSAKVIKAGQLMAFDILEGCMQKLTLEIEALHTEVTGRPGVFEVATPLRRTKPARLTRRRSRSRREADRPRARPRAHLQRMKVERQPPGVARERTHQRALWRATRARSRDNSASTASSKTMRHYIGGCALMFGRRSTC